MTTNRRTRPPRPAANEAALLAELAPRLDRLADDVWVLARRAPSLTADPALLGEAGRVLSATRRLLRREPGHRLLPKTFPPGIGLAALAVSLRQVQVAARLVARRPSAPGTAEAIEATTRLTALLLADTAHRLAARRGLASANCRNLVPGCGAKPGHDGGTQPLGPLAPEGRGRPSGAEAG